MFKKISHEMALEPSRDEQSRQNFVAALRCHVLGDMAETMRDRYFERFESGGNKAEDGPAVHDRMQGDNYFRFYSSMRYNAQEMVFRSVIPQVERNLDGLIEQSAELRAQHNQEPELQEGFEVPDSVTKLDVHLAPGGYHTEYAAGDIATGAIYDNSINVFAFNQMGRDLSDIGHTMANYVRLQLPDLKPAKNPGLRLYDRL